MDFVDLHGASGCSYRFRRWPVSGDHPPIAGAYAVVREEDRRVVALGVSENLATSGEVWTKLEPGLEAYTRLNVSRALREAELADLASAHQSAGPRAS